MKYSLTFLYSLLLKDGYKVTDIKNKKEAYEVTVEHPTSGTQWVINLEPDPDDSVRNVLYQIKCAGNLSIIGNIGSGPIVVHKSK